jgi:YHS domain-containing protein
MFFKRKSLVIVSLCAFLGFCGGLFAAEQSTAKVKDSQTVAAKDHGKKVVEKKLASQKTCPVMGGEINKDLYVDYKGKWIYVCCEGCLAEIKKDPEKYLKKLEASGQSAEIIDTVKVETKKEKVQ